MGEGSVAQRRMIGVRGRRLIEVNCHKNRLQGREMNISCKLMMQMWSYEGKKKTHRQRHQNTVQQDCAVPYRIP